jgi:hypothetical protein
LIEMRIEDADGVQIVLVEVPAGHPSAVTCDRCHRQDDALSAAEADVHNVCEAVGVTFDLTGLAERIRMRAADWQSLSVSW